jgi:hypothetical protein
VVFLVEINKKQKKLKINDQKLCKNSQNPYKILAEIRYNNARKKSLFSPK